MTPPGAAPAVALKAAAGIPFSLLLIASVLRVRVAVPAAWREADSLATSG